MFFNTINIILSICLCVLIIILIYQIKSRIKEDKKTEWINENLKSQHDTLTEANNKLSLENDKLWSQYNSTKAMVENLEEQYQKTQEISQTTFENQKKLCDDAFSNYWKVLESCYKEKSEEFDNNIENLQKNFEKEKAEIESDLDKIRQTRASAIQANLREQEIKGKLSFYCLQVSPTDLADIQKLESIKPQLNNPRILSMLIWSTYFQKPMTALCNNVIGTTVKSGIYKITNQTNDLCYIGQAVDLATRWKAHAKCGLGIDTPQGNLLYKAMMADGLWNFSFEVLEECPKEDLNEKERYYIQLYQSKEYGYNSTAGNK